MKKVVALMLAVSFAGSQAVGGIVTFDPPMATVDPATGSTTVTFDVIVGSADLPGGFDAVEIILGSYELRLTDFAFARGFESILVATHVDLPAIPQVYPSDMQVGGFAVPYAEIDPLVLTPPMLIGTLRVDAAGLVPGDYSVVVDSDVDKISELQQSDGASEGLFGLATVRVVPEPATLTLLALAALGLVRRRRAA